ncbi:MAG: transposase [Planctomycetota bacterium]|jgi:hypothetical protein
MSGGRPTFGVDHVDGIDAPEEEKRRVKTVLLTMTGELSVAQACARLGLGHTRFHELRREILEAAVAGARPGRPGRPRKEEPAAAKEVRRLTRRVAWLEEELHLARMRTELAVALPGVLHPRPRRAKKGGSSPKRKRRG